MEFDKSKEGIKALIETLRYLTDKEKFRLQALCKTMYDFGIPMVSKRSSCKLKDNRTLKKKIELENDVLKGERFLAEQTFKRK
jgi:hypothetical protein